MGEERVTVCGVWQPGPRPLPWPPSQPWPGANDPSDRQSKKRRRKEGDGRCVDGCTSNTPTVWCGMHAGPDSTQSRTTSSLRRPSSSTSAASTRLRPACWANASRSYPRRHTLWLKYKQSKERPRPYCITHHIGTTTVSDPGDVLEKAIHRFGKHKDGLSRDVHSEIVLLQKREAEKGGG